jgi:hypothetical protein
MLEADIRWLVYWAGERDQDGLLAGEVKQATDERGRLLWRLEQSFEAVEVASASQPDPVNLSYLPVMLTGEGKERDLDLCRFHCSHYCPDVQLTDEQWCLPAPELRKLLEEFLDEIA